MPPFACSIASASAAADPFLRRSPDLVGPRVTAKAAELGGVLFARYQAASDYFTTIAKIIMSDYSKMSEVAAVATSNTRWKLAVGLASSLYAATRLVSSLST